MKMPVLPKNSMAQRPRVAVVVVLMLGKANQTIECHKRVQRSAGAQLSYSVKTYANITHIITHITQDQPQNSVRST